MGQHSKPEHRVHSCPETRSEVSKCFEVGGGLWKSRRLWAARPLKLGGSRVAGDIQSSNWQNSGGCRLVLKPLHGEQRQLYLVYETL